MKVFIEDRVTGKFIFSPCSWTEKEEEALDFESAARAKAFCAEHFLRDAQIIVRYGPGSPEVRLPGGATAEPYEFVGGGIGHIVHR